MEVRPASGMIDGRSPKELIPCLYQLTTRKKRTVAQELQGYFWLRQMRRMNSTTHVREFILLRQLIQQVHLDEEREDKLTWRWTSNGAYSANSAYRVQFLGSIHDDRFGYIWKAKMENKCKFFGWLMVQKKILISDKL